MNDRPMPDKTLEEMLAEVGAGHHANGFMACVIRAGEILIERPAISNGDLIRQLTHEAKNLPGYKIKPEEKQ